MRRNSKTHWIPAFAGMTWGEQVAVIRNIINNIAGT